MNKWISLLSALPILWGALVHFPVASAEEFLEPEVAFKFSARALDANTLEARWQIADGYYMYRDKFKFEVTGGTLGTPKLPASKMKVDEFFGKVETYSKDVRIVLPIARTQGATSVTLKTVSQGCAEAGVCYNPQTESVTIKLPALITAAALPPIVPAAAALDGLSGLGGMDMPKLPPDNESDTSRIESVLKGGSFWSVVAAFFGLGLLLAFTPCVFPMIPILSGIIAGQSTKVTKTSGFLLSLAYVLGMAITYALAGVAAALSGTLISNALQNPWALGAGALIFVGLALSMFGFYELQLPSALQSKFSERANKMRGGNFFGVFAMGALSAVILGPCVAPPLAAALAFIAQTGDTMLGGVALFVMALGMGVPLLLIGLSAGALLPHAGGWMNAVKYFFGVMMLAIAIYLISPIIPAWVNMLLWAMLLVGSAIYLHALDPLPAHANGWDRLWKGFGVVLLIGGLALILGMLAGSRDLLQPLEVYKGSVSKAGTGGSAMAAEQKGLAFENIKDVGALDARLTIAKADGKPVMLYFYADWCVSCKELERYTFSDPRVQARLKDVVLLKADVTATSDADKALLKRFKLFGPPGFIFWNAAGMQSDYKVIGFEKADKFLTSVASALGQ